VWSPSIKITSKVVLLFIKKLSEVVLILPPLTGSTPVLCFARIEWKQALFSQPISRYLQFEKFFAALFINAILLYSIKLQSIFYISSQKFSSFKILGSMFSAIV